MPQEANNLNTRKVKAYPIESVVSGFSAMGHTKDNVWRITVNSLQCKQDGAEGLTQDGEHGVPGMSVDASLSTYMSFSTNLLNRKCTNLTGAIVRPNLSCDVSASHTTAPHIPLPSSIYPLRILDHQCTQLFRVCRVDLTFAAVVSSSKGLVHHLRHHYFYIRPYTLCVAYQ